LGGGCVGGGLFVFVFWLLGLGLFLAGLVCVVWVCVVWVCVVWVCVVWVCVVWVCFWCFLVVGVFWAGFILNCRISVLSAFNDVLSAQTKTGLGIYSVFWGKGHGLDGISNQTFI
jgi:hypothetical protein